MKTEKEIRARIEKLSKELRSKVKIKTQRDLDREGIKGMMKLSERYALWWVLKEVRKNQGSQNKSSGAVKRDSK
jgi:hypothetical protein